MRSQKLISSLCGFCTLAFFITTAATAQISWIRHDISKNLRGASGLDGADINKDGRIDIVTASHDGVKWWRNGGAGSFSSGNIGSLEGCWSVHAADVDGDGDVDVMGASPHPNSNKTNLWLNGGSGGGWGSPIVFPLLEAEDVFAENLYGSGLMEIFGCSWAEDLPDSGNDLVSFENYLGGRYDRVVLDPNLSGAHSVVAADFDKDGDVDIVASGDGRVYVYPNSGGGTLAPRKEISTNGSLSLALADMDKDGDFDLVSQGRNPPNQNIYWYERTSGLSFVKHLVGTDIGECWSAHAGDFDGDGDMDISAASQTYRTIRAYINDGSFNFTEVPVVENFGTTSNGPGARAEFTLDVDGDGDDDIIGAAPGASTLAWFESVSVPSITVTAPNGGETWVVGSTHDITWNSASGINSVKIEFSTNGGSTWSVITGSAANSGKYSWIIPDSVSISCRVRVSDTANGAADMSDSFFSIVAPQFRLAAPNGNETWYVGDSRDITWVDEFAVGEIKIELTTDGGATWQTLATNAPNNGRYSWTVASSLSSSCRVRISDAIDGDPIDASDNSFTIAAPKLTITAPNGGEGWLIGSTRAIKWNTNGVIANVKLEFSINNGGTWQTIAASATNTCSYQWVIPNSPSVNCLVRVSDVADLTRSDVSNNVFAITEPYIKVVMPNGGEKLLMGSTQNVTWSSAGVSDQVKIELSRDLAATWDVLANSTANDGSFAWAVSGPATDGCLIRIADAANGALSDVSDAPFSIGSIAISILSPQGGEKWVHGSKKRIQWSVNGPLDNVRLEYSLNNGASWLVIAARTPNTGTFTWTLPNNTLSDSSRVRISGFDDGLPFSISNIFHITPPNQAPVADAGGPYTAPRQVEIMFDGSQSSDPDNDSLSYVWDFGDGQFGNGVQSLHAFANLRSYTVKLSVNDGRDGESISTTTVQIINRAPTAEAGGTYYGKPGLLVSFDASASTDPDGDAVTFVWDFGDGSAPFSGGPIASHVYGETGNYQVGIEVTDAFGGVDLDTALAIITNNLPPSVDLGPSELNLAGICGDSVAVLLKLIQAEDADGSIVSFDWDFGDNSAHSNSDSSLTHYFPAPGIYTVRLNVTDDQGATAMDTLRVSLVANLPPLAEFFASSDTILVNTEASFDASSSSDTDGRIVSFEWVFGDGTVLTTVQSTVSHLYETIGSFTVTLAVADSCGKADTTTQVVHVMQSVEVSDREIQPAIFALTQNVPNPISLSTGHAAYTRIAFNLPYATEVQLKIFNLFGQEVRTLVRGQHLPGGYTATWDLRDARGAPVSAGIYFYRLFAGSRLETKKMIVVR